MTESCRSTRDAVAVLGEGAVAHEPVQARVLDGDARSHGQREDQLLVVLGELLGVLLVGQVQIPVDLAVDPHGHPEERGHGGVARRDPVTVGAVCDVAQPQRFVVGDERAEDAPTRRARADGLLLLGAEAHGEELVERPPILGQHAQRPVLGVDQVAGLLDDPAQHHREVELGVEDQDRLDETPQFGGIIDPVEGLHGLSG